MARYGRKPKKKKRPGPAPLSNEEEELLHSILSDPADINPDNILDHIGSPALATALLERLPPGYPEIGNLIVAIKEAFEEKDVQKSVKRAFFRLKQQGISIPRQETPKESPFIFKDSNGADPEAYLGPIDGTGTRGVLIMIPRIPKGVDVGIGLINSGEGIKQFIFDRYSKKRSREVKELFFEQVGKAVDTSLSHAATVIEKSYLKSGQKTEKSSNDYLKLRPWILENVQLLDQPAIYESIPREDISGEILTDSRVQKMLGHELMLSWIMEPDEIQSLMDEILKAEESPIIVSEEQKTTRIHEIKEKAVMDLFPDSRRLQIKEDLEEMAFLFFKLNEEEFARSCLLAASVVDEKSSSIRTNTFLLSFLEYSLDYYGELIHENSEEKVLNSHSSPLIITP